MTYQLVIEFLAHEAVPLTSVMAAGSDANPNALQSISLVREYFQAVHLLFTVNAVQNTTDGVIRRNAA